MDTPHRTGQTRARMRSVDSGRVTPRIDLLATEEPLQIRIRQGRRIHPIAVTMRTPGHDFELAAGFLFAENLIQSRHQIHRIEYCLDCDDVLQRYNIVTAALKPTHNIDLLIPERNFGMTSSCGLCGKERLDQIERQGIQPLPTGPTVDWQIITSLPAKLRDAQGLFTATGGLHAAGLFNAAGDLLALREDVGRHNAVDKVIGWALLEGHLPLADHLLMVSGRSSFEIAQKTLAAGIPILAAVSAPSSLAVDLAKRFDLTLIGFLRDQRFNIYSTPDRISL